MIERVRNYIEKYKLIESDEHILVGVSGGADSVCLFFLLFELSKKMTFEYSVIHVNHGIRQTAKRDELFVKELCKKHQIPFHVAYADVPKMTSEQKLSIEEAARFARYDAFYKKANELALATGKKVKLAVAHNENDQAETVLFHLFRGCSLIGLRGMKPMRCDENTMYENEQVQSDKSEHAQKNMYKTTPQIIRPLLCISRKEIDAYLSSNGYTHIEDETNACNDYSRNFIRNELLIQAENEICNGASSHIAQTAEKMLELEDYLSIQIHRTYETLIERKDESRKEIKEEIDEEVDKQSKKIDEEVDKQSKKTDEETDKQRKKETNNERKEAKANQILAFDAKKLKNQHPYMQSSLIYKALEELSKSKKDITNKHVESVLALLSMQVGRQVHLPYQIVAKREYEKLILFKELDIVKKDTKTEQKTKITPIQLIIPGITQIRDGLELKASIFPYEKAMELPKNEYTKWFDYDKIIRCLFVRNRESADYFYIDKEHKKMVKRYMIDKKIKKEQRDELLLICEDTHMLWMPGFRISEFYKVDEHTNTILELSLIGGTKDV